jgi:hypothetical protein
MTDYLDNLEWLLEHDSDPFVLSRSMAASIAAELRALREALTLIRDQAEPQHPTGTWARDVARKALAKVKEARGG